MEESQDICDPSLQYAAYEDLDRYGEVFQVDDAGTIRELAKRGNLTMVASP